MADTSEKLIHVKLEYDEAVNTKRYILTSEKDLLRMMQTIRSYNSIRMEELKYKLRLQKKLYELNLNIKKLRSTLPRIEIPKILKDNFEKEEVYEKLKFVKEKQKNQSIEEQLQEIQDKLSSL